MSEDEYCDQCGEKDSRLYSYRTEDNKDIDVCSECYDLLPMEY